MWLSDKQTGYVIEQNMTAWLSTIWKAIWRPSGKIPSVDEAVGLGHYGDDFLIALHEGFFVLSREKFAELRLRALSPTDQAEYRKLLIYSGGRELRKAELEQRLCKHLAIEISRPGAR